MAYIGIDLGGTNIAVGAVNEEGQILSQVSVPTGASRPYQELVKDMAQCVKDAAEKAGLTLSDIKSVGIGIPGVAEEATGVVFNCTNLGWFNVPLRQELQKYIDLPVYIDNDANVAALAESYAGVSKNCRSSVMLTLGTGVGGGIVIDGKPWSGAHGRGGEIGHMTLIPDGVPCTCGNNGCVERYCSATALIRMGRQECFAFEGSQMLVRTGGDPEKLNARIVIDCAKEGDACATRVFNDFVRFLAMAINNITAFFDPEMIVLGGGVSGAGDFLLKAVEALLPRYQMFKALPIPKVAIAKLGNEAGIIGAAMLGKSK
ncbi:MAG: ROK family glucokinase [Clostridia bacterium]|nr:ROK family glucokinase [Clostridia bacterium]